MTSDSKRLAALAIDDEPADLKILRYTLQDVPGWDVELVTHHDADQALDAFEEGQFDVVLLDYFLGERNGIELFQSIEALGRHVPTILLTEHGDEEIAVECLKAGMADYIPKHLLTPKSLRRSIGNAIEKSTLRRSLEEYRQSLEQSVRDLRSRNDEIQSFYHLLSHELKTPLTAAREFISIVLEEITGPVNEEQKDLLATAKKGCDQIERHVNDMLDASRLDTGKLAIQPGHHSIAELVRRVITFSTSKAESAGVRLESELDGDLPQAWVDAERTLQVLTNLVNNAVKFTEHGGCIAVRAVLAAGGHGIDVSVSDTGRGIDPHKIDRIFDRLYQASDEDAATLGGLGLGLNLCRELVRLQGGEIRVESELGRGSTFTFSVPVQCQLAHP